MIERDDVMPISFLKLEKFTGSYQGMRYRMEKAVVTVEEGEDAKEETVLRVVQWPEPFAYDFTSDDQKKSETFSFDEKGIEDGIAWLNQCHDADYAGWKRN
ncbi:MAG: hypothetical protein LIV11_11975 [Bacillota bacterium]|nr:hypothetical protein [Bacillota bacterium]